jgi:hypothetical protein
MVKLTKKVLIGIIVAVVVVAGIVGFLLIRPRGIKPGKLYELPKQTFLVGETYTYDYSFGTEVLGQRMDYIGQWALDVVDTSKNESTIRMTMVLTMPTLPEMPEEIKVVMLMRMTNEGEVTSTKIESVDPPKLRASMEQQLGAQQQQPTSMLPQTPAYPEKPLPLGGKWEIPIDQEVEQPTGTVKTTGKTINCLADEEKLTTPAGTFDCFKITSTINATTTMPLGKNQTIIMDMLGDIVYWLNTENGALIKLSSNIEGEMRMGTSITAKVPVDMKIELIECKQA